MQIQGTSHKHDGIKEKLRNLGVKENAVKEIMNDIFGHQIASTCYNGSTDGKEVSEFDAKVHVLRAACDEVNPDFHPWFVSTQRDAFIGCLIAPVREEAGLTHVGSTYIHH